MEMESESESQILAGIFGAEHCTQNLLNYNNLDPSNTIEYVLSINVV